MMTKIWINHKILSTMTSLITTYENSRQIYIIFSINNITRGVILLPLINIRLASRLLNLILTFFRFRLILNPFLNLKLSWIWNYNFIVHFCFAVFKNWLKTFRFLPSSFLLSVTRKINFSKFFSLKKRAKKSTLTIKAWGRPPLLSWNQICIV